MRHIYVLLFVLLVTATAINAQEVRAENIHKNHSELIQDSSNPIIQGNKKATDNDLIHRYLCQRCGSENQMDWTITNGKHLELIPHCGFCGKKYWPKFKPSGFLERTYSFHAPVIRADG